MCSAILVAVTSKPVVHCSASSVVCGGAKEVYQQAHRLSCGVHAFLFTSGFTPGLSYEVDLPPS